jgi:hypothetical protein
MPCLRKQFSAHARKKFLILRPLSLFNMQILSIKGAKFIISRCVGVVVRFEKGEFVGQKWAGLGCPPP